MSKIAKMLIVLMMTGEVVQEILLTLPASSVKKVN